MQFGHFESLTFNLAARSARKIEEWVKRTSLETRPKPLHFYRTRHGTEVDLLVETREKTLAFEMKFAHRLTSRMTQPLEQFLKEHADAQGYVLSLSTTPQALSPNIQAIHWSKSFDLA